MNATRRRVLASAAAGAMVVLAGCRRDIEAQSREASAASGLRIDVRHSVRDAGEEFAIVELIREPRASSLHPRAAEWGDYRLSIVDAATRTLLAQIGFDSNVAGRCYGCEHHTHNALPFAHRAVHGVDRETPRRQHIPDDALKLC